MSKKIILSESEKNRILGMHKKAVESDKKVISEATLKDIQTILIQRGFLPATSESGKPSDDNQLGPNTLAALQKALNPTPAQGTPAQGTPAEGTPAEGTPVQADYTPKVGNVYEGTLQDNAEGLIMKVVSITPIKECNLKEVELEHVGFPNAKHRFGYLEGSENDIRNMSRTSEGMKSPNPCQEIKEMRGFGNLEPEGTRAKLGLK